MKQKRQIMGVVVVTTRQFALCSTSPHVLLRGYQSRRNDLLIICMHLRYFIHALNVFDPSEMLQSPSLTRNYGKVKMRPYYLTAGQQRLSPKDEL